MSLNYTAADTLECLTAVVLFLVAGITCGYVTGWFTGILEFRTLSVPWRLLIAVPFSASLYPILIYWAGVLLGNPGPLALFGFFVGAFMWLLVVSPGHERFGPWRNALRGIPPVAWLIAAVWIVVVVGSLADLQIGSRLYYSAAAVDLNFRTGITDAITRTGVRPDNPDYFIHGSAPLRYHYFWFLFSSLVNRLGGAVVDGRIATAVSCAWVGLGLAAMVPLYLRFFNGHRGESLRRRSIVGIALFAVTGLDIIPTAMLALRGGFYSDMEQWNDQVTSWLASVLWAPHHVASFVAGLLAFLITWDVTLPDRPFRRRFLAAIAAGLALATCAGCSVYVSFVLAVFFTFWVVFAFYTGRRTNALILAAAGVIALAAILPHFRSLAVPGAGGMFVSPTIRAFSLVSFLQRRFSLGPGAGKALRLLLLPLNYFLELGLFLAVGAITAIRLYRRRPILAHTQAAIAMATISILFCTFFRQRNALLNNDPGWRGFLPAQFVLLLWAADLFIERKIDTTVRSRWWFGSATLATLAFLGVCGTVYEAAMLRLCYPLVDAGILPGTSHPGGSRIYAFRSALEQLDRTLPITAVVQQNPNWTWEELDFGLYAHRQTAAIDARCHAEIGGDPAACAHFVPLIGAIFTDPKLTAAQASETCREVKIDAVVVTDLDPIWKDRGSWIWSAVPVVENSHVRAFLTSTMSGSAPRGGVSQSHRTSAAAHE
jgi:hypothetical protein